jgi:CRISPR-associated protein Csm1
VAEIEMNVRMLVMAGLLHDIGKLIQRTDSSLRKTNHAELGSTWLTKMGLGDFSPFALFHHSPHDTMAAPANPALVNQLAILEEADAVAVGEPEWQEEWIESVALTSIFWNLRLTEESRRDYKHAGVPWVYRPRPLDNVIPYPEPRVGTDDAEYGRLLDGLEQDLNQLTRLGQLKPDPLLNVLETWTSFIPSETASRVNSTEGHQDVSLYDHSRLTAAIGACLAMFFSDHGTLISDLSKDYIRDRTESRFLLVAGDVSGIQDFLYTITYKAALKGLRGRSFYLELLTEHAVSRILEELHLPRCHVIFQGGGSFFILVANTASVVEAISKIRDRLNEWLLGEHSGRLFVALDWMDLCASSFTTYLGCKEHPNIADAWGKVLRKLDVQKSRKFARSMGPEFFAPQPIIGEPCQICKKLGAHARTHFMDPDTGDTLILCDSCNDLAILGEHLPDCKRIARCEMAPKRDERCVGVQIDDKYWHIAGHRPERIEQEYSLNPTDRKVGTEVVYVGLYPDKPVEFNDLIKEGMGADFLGTLRMDVDNLGRLFSKGLPNEYITLSRLATLSRLLNMFFKRYVRTIASADPCLDIKPLRLNTSQSGARNLVIVYAGGDDLFVTGAWNEVAESAFDIRRSFKKYTCENPDIGLSAGMVVTNSKLPIYRIASYAGEAEEAAKSTEDEFGKKDGAALFFVSNDVTTSTDTGLKLDFSVQGRSVRRRTSSADAILKWSDWERMLVYIESFLKLGTFTNTSFSPDFGKALLYRLMNASEDWKTCGSIAIPAVVYALARANKEAWQKDESKLEAWSLIFNNALNMEFLRAAPGPLRWIELLTRGGANQ